MPLRKSQPTAVVRGAAADLPNRHAAPFVGGHSSPVAAGHVLANSGAHLPHYFFPCRKFRFPHGGWNGIPQNVCQMLKETARPLQYLPAVLATKQRHRDQ